MIYRIAIWRPDDTIQNDGTDAAYSKTWLHPWWAVVFGWSWNPSWNMIASQLSQIPWRDIRLGIHIGEWQDIDMWCSQWKILYGGMTKYGRLVNSYWIVGVMRRSRLIHKDRRSDIKVTRQPEVKLLNKEWSYWIYLRNFPVTYWP